MIIGIGTDIVHVSRIREAIAQYGERFLRRIFTEEEREYCDGMPHKEEHYAARFAAKEAFSKAIGTGVTGDFKWTHCGIRREKSGQPFFELDGALKEVWGNYRLHVSLSHTSDYAMAVAVIEREG